MNYSEIRSVLRQYRSRHISFSTATSALIIAGCSSDYAIQLLSNS